MALTLRTGGGIISRLVFHCPPMATMHEKWSRQGVAGEFAGGRARRPGPTISGSPTPPCARQRTARSRCASTLPGRTPRGTGSTGTPPGCSRTTPWTAGRAGAMPRAAEAGPIRRATPTGSARTSTSWCPRTGKARSAGGGGGCRRAFCALTETRNGLWGAYPTVSRGRFTNGVDCGAGLYFTNCVVRDNTTGAAVSFTGGGRCFVNGTLRILNTAFLNNKCIAALRRAPEGGLIE